MRLLLGRLSPLISSRRAIWLVFHLQFLDLWNQIRYPERLGDHLYLLVSMSEYNNQRAGTYVVHAGFDCRLDLCIAGLVPFVSIYGP